MRRIRGGIDTPAGESQHWLRKICERWISRHGIQEYVGARRTDEGGRSHRCVENVEYFFGRLLVTLLGEGGGSGKQDYREYDQRSVTNFHGGLLCGIGGRKLLKLRVDVNTGSGGGQMARRRTCFMVQGGRVLFRLVLLTRR